MWLHPRQRTIGRLTSALVCGTADMCMCGACVVLLTGWYRPRACVVLLVWLYHLRACGCTAGVAVLLTCMCCTADMVEPLIYAGRHQGGVGGRTANARICHQNAFHVRSVGGGGRAMLYVTCGWALDPCIPLLPASAGGLLPLRHAHPLQILPQTPTHLSTHFLPPPRSPDPMSPPTSPPPHPHLCVSTPPTHTSSLRQGTCTASQKYCTSTSGPGGCQPCRCGGGGRRGLALWGWGGGGGSGKAGHTWVCLPANHAGEGGPEDSKDFKRVTLGSAVLPLFAKADTSTSSPLPQANLACVWPLYWWTPPHGRAFTMSMCTLKARALGAKVSPALCMRIYCCTAHVHAQGPSAGCKGGHPQA